ncbi:MAG: hypothetical protein COT74_07110 [Bdellovibrionales bacterium CG10_big_fil_rev_8_21_14_0_10_45_34]|nr:MAG: hypothetical protein COT74_07110 [Bdellovibrionales bacterium CG10_big_fil_rev_8_21_14_0_10_45_34]
MRRLFVQSTGFYRILNHRPDGEEILRRIEWEILNNPEVGDLVQSTGGVRKMRIADHSRGKGKRGGMRVLYLDLPDRNHTHLIWIYSKDDADDLSPSGKKMIRLLVEKIKGAFK